MPDEKTATVFKSFEKANSTKTPTGSIQGGYIRAYSRLKAMIAKGYSNLTYDRVLVNT